MLLDVFHVAELFRNEHPEDFEILTKIPATYERIHYKRYYVRAIGKVGRY
jgi:hypothetical protein